MFREENRRSEWGTARRRRVRGLHSEVKSAPRASPPLLGPCPADSRRLGAGSALSGGWNRQGNAASRLRIPPIPARGIARRRARWNMPMMSSRTPWGRSLCPVRSWAQMPVCPSDDRVQRAQRPMCGGTGTEDGHRADPPPALPSAPGRRTTPPPESQDRSTVGGSSLPSPTVVGDLHPVDNAPRLGAREQTLGTASPPEMGDVRRQ